MYFLLGVAAFVGLLVARKIRSERETRQWIKSIQESHKDYVESRKSNPTPEVVGISLFDAVMQTGEYVLVSKESDYYAITMHYGLQTQPLVAVMIYDHYHHNIETLKGELLLDNFGNIREMNSFAQRVKQTEQKYPLLNGCLFSECISDTARGYFNQWYASRHQQARYEEPRTTTKPAGTPVYFSGCNNEESLKRRYHQLSKIYHPDANGGSREIFEKITAEYRNLQRMYA